MVVVAVAGGTGGVGRAILEALLTQGKHDVRILSRTADKAKEAELGAPLIATNYEDVGALIQVLEDNNIHTVISAMNMLPQKSGSGQELNLIKAADASKTTKRMVSSDYSVDPIEGGGEMFASINTRREAWDVLMSTKNLEWTVFRTGYFMDYWGLPRVKSYLDPFIQAFDMQNNMAVIPGSGDRPVALTHTIDIGKYVAASLDLEKWDHVNYVMGDRVTYNEVLKLAEEAKGTKFQVTYDSVEKMERGEATELPGQVPMYQFLPKPMYLGMVAAFGIWVEHGDFEMNGVKLLNGAFPDIKPMTVKQMMDAAWKKK